MIGGEKLKGKLAWLKPSAIGLSTGLSGFFSGAASQLAAFAADRASGGYAKNAVEEMKKRNLFIDEKTGKVKDIETLKAIKRELTIQAWCHQHTTILTGVLEGKMPARPAYVRATLTVAEAMQVALDASAHGARFDEETRKTLQSWNNLPESLKSAKVDVDFLTSDIRSEEHTSELQSH